MNFLQWVNQAATSIIIDLYLLRLLPQTHHQRRERFALFGLYFAEASFSCQPARLSHIIIM